MFSRTTTSFVTSLDPFVLGGYFNEFLPGTNKVTVEE